MRSKQQAKAQQAIDSGVLNQKNITVNQAQNKHIQVKIGDAYQVIFQQKNKALNVDFDVIAKKTGDDLILLLDDSTTVVFDDYFLTCLDLSCMVSLPAAGALYHVIDERSKLLSGGTEILYVYGDKSILEEIASSDRALLKFLGQSHVDPEDSSWSLSTLGVGALGVLALAGGSGSSGGDSTTKFSISGDISAGQVIEGQDLEITVRGKDGEFKADEFEASIEDDGSFSIQIKKEYADYLIVEVKGGGSEKDYKDEGDGKEVNLSTPLRVVVKADGKTNITAMLNPLTEIIVRKVLDGESTDDELTLEEVGDDIADNLATANTAVGKAFNAEGVDINSTKPAVVNADSYDSAASADSKALGRALAGISGMENQDRDGEVDDETVTLDTVLTTLTAAIDDNGVLTEKVKADFLAGLGQANEQPDNEEIPDTYTKKFESIITDTGIEISDDKDASGNNDNDFITKTKAQTITATLESALESDETLWGSVDSGATWGEVTVSNTSISWDISLKEWDKQELIENQTLPKGQYIIQFAITENKITESDEVVGNTKGNIAKQSYTLDMTAAEKATITKMTTTKDKDLESGATTNDIMPSIRISLTGTNAKEGDRIQVLEDESHSKYVTLTKEDIDRDWAEVSLSLSVESNNDNKDYSFKVKIIDQVGNNSALSDAFLVTFDGDVEALTLALKEDTGKDSSDGVTSNKAIVIGNIEKDATVEYILDGGTVWTTLTETITYNDDKGTVEIALNDDAEYAAGNIKVRQTDSAGNINTVDDITKNSAWTIDNTAAVYEPDDQLSFVRTFKNNDSDVVREVCITLTFDEDIVKPSDFEKTSFTVNSFNDNGDPVPQTIGRVKVSGKEVKLYILGDITSSGINLSYSYTQADNSKPLQDKAGNPIDDISEQLYTLDNAAPNKAEISYAITDNDNQLKTGKTTNDFSIYIRVSLIGTNAEKDDKIQIMTKEGDDTSHKYSQDVTLDDTDISNGYKDVLLSRLTADENSSDKDYSFQARIIDQTGNKGALSDAFLITYDGSVETLTLELDSDTGTSTTDGITSDNKVIIGNIEKDATVKYTLTSGAEWVTITANHDDIDYNEDDIGTLTINLEQNKVYESSTIRAQQIDEAGNESTTIKNSREWTTDNTAPTYDDSKDVVIVRIKDETTDLFESRITVTLTEDVIKLPNFDKDSFSVFLGTSRVKSIIKNVILNGKNIQIVVDGDIQTADTSELGLFYTQIDDTKALQDKAGNLLTSIGSSSNLITFTFDQDKPVTPKIESVTDNRANNEGGGTGEVADNAITDDNTLDIKVSFTTDDTSTAAVKGDFLRYYTTENSDDILIKTVTLTQSDINKGYKITTLTSLDSTAAGKDYVLSAKLADQTGNISDASTVKNFTVDATVAQASMVLEFDSSATGAPNADKKTSVNRIEVSNIEEGATWQYSIDGGDNWLDGGSVYEDTLDDPNKNALENALDDIYIIELEQNKTYSSGDIKVRQTDRAGNTNGDTDHSTIPYFYGEIVTDNIQPEYRSFTVLAGSNQIVLSFSESLYSSSTSGTTDSGVKNAFNVTVGDTGNQVTKVVYKDNQVILSLQDNIDSDFVKIDYTKPTGTTTRENYQLKDIVGNLVDNFKVGSSGVDDLVGTDGNETIIGSGGNDTLTGGTGTDTFDYNATTDGNDTITDFTIGDGGDKLDLKDLLSYSSGDELGDFLAVTDGTDGGDVTIEVDANGDGSGGADLTITLSDIGTGALALTDFDTHNLIVL